MKKLIAVLLTAAMLLSLAACGGAESEGTDVAEPKDLRALYNTLAVQMPEMVVLDQTMMLNFCGIAAEDCVQAVAATCADGLRTDEVWLIEAVDEAALGRLKALAEIRLMIKGEESISYSPEQYAVVEKAKLFTDGLYLFLLVSPDVSDLTKVVRDYLG